MDENKTKEVISENTSVITAAPVAIKERLKSWAVWASVFGAVAVILNAFGLFEKLGIDSAEFDTVINSVGTVLIAFGILNNPTDRAAF